MRKNRRSDDRRTGMSPVQSRPTTTGSKLRIPPSPPIRDPLTEDPTGSIELLRQEREKLESAIEQLKPLLVEGHQLLKDLRIECRQARRVMPMLMASQIKRRMDEQLPPFFEELGQHVEQAKITITSRFDKLYDSLMGNDPKSRKNGLPPIDQLIKMSRTVAEASAQHARNLDLQNAAESKTNATKPSADVPTIEGFNNL